MVKAPAKTKPPRSAPEMSVTEVALPMAGDQLTSAAVGPPGALGLKAMDQSSSWM